MRPTKRITVSNKNNRNLIILRGVRVFSVRKTHRLRRYVYWILCLHARVELWYYRVSKKKKKTYNDYANVARWRKPHLFIILYLNIIVGLSAEVVIRIIVYLLFWGGFFFQRFSTCKRFWTDVTIVYRISALRCSTTLALFTSAETISVSKSSRTSRD